MRTTITTDAAGYVTLSYDDEYEGRVTREFSVPPNGGYIREHLGNGRTTQPCEKLATRGNTLMASSRTALADVIRREYRAMRRAEKKDRG